MALSTPWPMPSKHPSDFKPGDAVMYVPTHVHGDIHHRDVERGIVTVVTTKHVFVRFGGELSSKACNANTLVKEYT